jgi:hypothetical protein
MMKALKSKERRGSIFIDKVNKVVSTVENEDGTFDYLIEWNYYESDKLKPTTSLVKGEEFAFAAPLLYRSYVEKQFIQQLQHNLNQSQIGSMYTPMMTPEKLLKNDRGDRNTSGLKSTVMGSADMKDMEMEI